MESDFSPIKGDTFRVSGAERWVKDHDVNGEVVYSGVYSKVKGDSTDNVQIGTLVYDQSRGYYFIKATHGKAYCCKGGIDSEWRAWSWAYNIGGTGWGAAPWVWPEKKMRVTKIERKKKKETTELAKTTGVEQHKKKKQTESAKATGIVEHTKRSKPNIQKPPPITKPPIPIFLIHGKRKKALKWPRSFPDGGLSKFVEGRFVDLKNTEYHLEYAEQVWLEDEVDWDNAMEYFDSQKPPRLELTIVPNTEEEPSRAKGGLGGDVNYHFHGPVQMHDLISAHDKAKVQKTMDTH